MNRTDKWSFPVRSDRRKWKRTLCHGQTANIMELCSNVNAVDAAWVFLYPIFLFFFFFEKSCLKIKRYLFETGVMIYLLASEYICFVSREIFFRVGKFRLSYVKS